MSASFEKLATVTASTKRSSVSGAGQRGARSENISSLSCTPLVPVDATLRASLQLDTPHELLQTFVDGGLDILPGDQFIVGSDTYEVRSVAEWYWRPGAADRLHVIVQETRR